MRKVHTRWKRKQRMRTHQGGAILRRQLNKTMSRKMEMGRG
ncbi:MAG: hypothetical protein AABX13_03115 [Nanoarchaeota archaeon]